MKKRDLILKCQEPWRIFILIPLLLLSWSQKGIAHPDISPEKACQFYTAQMEQAYKIPDKLLRAISLAESGRPTNKGPVAWPWTINVGGKGLYFPTKKAAIQAVHRLQKKGIKSIDVGCMQVNLYHHPHAFKNLEQAFDPQTNISYAAKFLRDLKASHKNWHAAVAHYHSATPLLHIPYQKKILKTWLEEKKKGREETLRTALWSPKKYYRWPIRPIGRQAPRRFSPPPAPLTVQRVRSPNKRLQISSYRPFLPKKMPPLLAPVRKIRSLKQAYLSSKP